MCSKTQNDYRCVPGKPKRFRNCRMHGYSSSKISSPDPSVALKSVSEQVRMPHSMRRQTNIRKIALQKCLENAKRRKMALRLLKEGKRSLRDIAQRTNVDKSTLSRISKFLRKNNNIGLQKMLNHSKVKGGAPTILTSEEEAMIAQRLIFARKRGFASIRVRMRQSDEDTAAEILNIARNVQNASRMVQRITTVIKNQKTVNSILMNLHPVRSVSVPDRKRTSLPSGAPTEHLTVGEMLAERRKIDEEKLRKEEEQQKRKDHRLAEKLAKRAKEVCSEGAKQVILMHVAFS